LLLFRAFIMQTALFTVTRIRMTKGIMDRHSTL
jgi:hypothetical protein